MSQLDVLKEKIAYLKLWLSIMVVTDISLVGWLLGNYTVANRVLIIGDVVAIFVISFGIYVLHKRIEKEIERLKEF
ncbi:MAG: hypothetical protein HYS70_06150 [Nitrospinae bacterium]|nr:hypothetical protein [Nitrospinota bacterium]